MGATRPGYSLEARESLLLEELSSLTWGVGVGRKVGSGTPDRCLDLEPLSVAELFTPSRSPCPLFTRMPEGGSPPLKTWEGRGRVLRGCSAGAATSPENMWAYKVKEQ